MNRVLGVVAPILKGGSKSTRQKDDDFIDRLSHTYTVLILLAFAIIVSTSNYVGEPIQCWVPAYFVSAYVDYTKKICWVSNTYYSPFESDVPKVGEPRKELVYYQWVPLILVAQAFLFYIPSILWITFYPKSGADISSLVASARVIQDKENPEKELHFIVYHFSRFCRHPTKRRGNALSRKCCQVCGMQFGSFIVGLYLMTKFIYFLNAFAQFFLLNIFLGTDYHLYGLEVIKGLALNNEWQPTPRFPRETLCDFRVRQLGNIHRYTVQCVLPINLFNEKIFIVIWFWIVLLLVASGISLIVWTWRATCGRNGISIIRSYLMSNRKLRSDDDSKASHNITAFVNGYLKADGLLVLRLLAVNTNELVVSEIVGALWDNYKANLEEEEV